MSNSKAILLSICVITYNQEEYVLETLKGIFLQKIDFNCELVIFDDCSSDTTQKIINKFLIENNSKFINVFFNVNTNNIGVSQNFINALSSCTGKYIAICEGDDYWSDSLKLKKQINFLESNQNYSMCFHDVHLLKNKIIITDTHLVHDVSVTSSYNDILCLGKYMQTCSVVFINKIHDFPIEKLNFLNDYILWFWISQFGYIYHFNEIMGVYRLGSGTWSVLSDVQKIKQSINSLVEVKKIVKDKNDIIIIDNRIASLKFSLLPKKLQNTNVNSFSLNEYLVSNIHLSNLFFSIFIKIKKKIFNIC